jgi:hypothetical protein
MVFLAALIMGQQLLLAEIIDYDEVLTGKTPGNDLFGN